MTKNEIITEIKNAINANGGEVCVGDIDFYVDGDYVKVRSWHYKDVLNDKSDEELNQHLYYIKGLIKKDILMGLHENREVKCDIETAKELEAEGFIHIESYEDGVLYGEVDYDVVCENLIDEDDLGLFGLVREDSFDHCDIDQVTDWYDMGYLEEIEYGGDGIWYCRVDWDGILTNLCERWNNNLYEAA